MLSQPDALNVTVIGCGRWGSFIGWYLDRIGHKVTLYGLESAPSFSRLVKERKNEYIELPDSIGLTSEIATVKEADVIVISVNSQNLRSVAGQLRATGAENKTIVLCMKGIEIETGKRLSEIVEEIVSSTNRIAVWIGPGHVQSFYRGIPNCMVIDSKDAATKDFIIQRFSGDLIRFYYGNDLIGNEIGAASKNVIGIAAGMLDGFGLTSLKGALMARGTRGNFPTDQGFGRKRTLRVRSLSSGRLRSDGVFAVFAQSPVRGIVCEKRTVYAARGRLLYGGSPDGSRRSDRRGIADLSGGLRDSLSRSRSERDDERSLQKKSERRVLTEK